MMTRAVPVSSPHLPQESRPNLPGQQNGAHDDAFTSSPRSSFQTRPRFHLRTRTFNSSWVEISIGLAMVTTALQLVFAMLCAASGQCMDVDLFRCVSLKSLEPVFACHQSLSLCANVAKTCRCSSSRFRGIFRCSARRRSPTTSCLRGPSILHCGCSSPGLFLRRLRWQMRRYEKNARVHCALAARPSSRPRCPCALFSNPDCNYLSSATSLHLLWAKVMHSIRSSRS